MPGLLDLKQPQQQPVQPLLGAYQPPNLLDSSRALLANIMRHKPLERAGGNIAIGDVVEQGLNFVPGIGDLMSAQDAVDYARQGRPYMAGLSGLGAIPILGTVGDALGKSVKIMDMPSFRKWFGESKLIDESGNPIIMYHGTNAEFDAFDPNAVGRNWADDTIGFYFSDEDTGKWYAAQLAKERGGKERVIPAYLSMQNPLIIPAWPGVETGRNAVGQIENQFNTASNALEHALNEGYDGVIIRNKNGRVLFAAVEKPNQIKSIFNKGTFNPKDTRINY